MKVQWWVFWWVPVLLGLLLIVGVPACMAGEVNGTASWYGGGEKLNRCTANGEVFDPTQLTCASWNYPFGTLLRVENKANGKVVFCRVNDRGPSRRLFPPRIIDLSREAFYRIEDLHIGLVNVKVEPVPNFVGGSNANDSVFPVSKGMEKQKR